jgi:hypothetical protein
VYLILKKDTNKVLLIKDTLEDVNLQHIVVTIVKNQNDVQNNCEKIKEIEK